MGRDFDMIVHHFDHDITIIPIADVHLGARECMEQEFMAFIQSVTARPDVYVCLLGDLLNNGVKTSVTNIYEEVYRPMEAKKLMTKLLTPIRDRILFSVTGNHERRSSKEVDDDPNYDIMAKLDLEHLYRENIAFVKIQMGEQVKGNSREMGRKRPCYTIVATHGSGGGAMTGAAVNKNERFGYAIDNMDALIVGHSHRPGVTQPGKIMIDTRNNLVTIKPFKVITATSWLTSGGYAMQKMLTPTSHALQTLTLKARRKEMLVTM